MKNKNKPKVILASIILIISLIFIVANSNAINLTGAKLADVIYTNTTLIYGDTNADNKISSADATLIARYLAGMDSFNSQQKILADVDGDGQITVNDKQLILNYIVGLPERGRVGQIYISPNLQPVKNNNDIVIISSIVIIGIVGIVILVKKGGKK